MPASTGASSGWCFVCTALGLPARPVCSCECLRARVSVLVYTAECGIVCACVYVCIFGPACLDGSMSALVYLAMAASMCVRGPGPVCTRVSLSLGAGGADNLSLPALPSVSWIITICGPAWQRDDPLCPLLLLTSLCLVWPLLILFLSFSGPSHVPETSLCKGLSNWVGGVVSGICWEETPPSPLFSEASSQGLGLTCHQVGQDGAARRDRCLPTWARPPHPAFLGLNTMTYIHPCILGPALREGDSDGDRFPPPQVLRSSSQHPLCPF